MAVNPEGPVFSAKVELYLGRCALIWQKERFIKMHILHVAKIIAKCIQTTCDRQLARACARKDDGPLYAVIRDVGGQPRVELYIERVVMG